MPELAATPAQVRANGGTRAGRRGGRRRERRSGLRKLNALAPISLRSLKRVLNAAPDKSLKVALEVEGHFYEKLRSTEDYIEGINAFRERRKATYKGR